MQVKDQAAYDDWKAKNADGYGAACFEYAERWADLIEAHLSLGDTLESVAKATSHEADKGIGITGFMYGMAVSILSHCWIHGEALRRWHNLDTQIGTEGEKANESGTVLNPALLCIG